VPFLLDRGELPVLEVTAIALVLMAVVYSPIFVSSARRAASVVVILLGGTAILGTVMVDSYLDAEPPTAIVRR